MNWFHLVIPIKEEHKRVWEVPNSREEAGILMQTTRALMQRKPVPTPGKPVRAQKKRVLIYFHSPFN